MKRYRKRKILSVLLLAASLFITACGGGSISSANEQSRSVAVAESTAQSRAEEGAAPEAPDRSYTQNVFSSADIPEYSGAPYVAMNGNIPYFTADDITDVSFESYSSLDALGRCGEAFACCGQDLMPTERRGDISEVKPTGWHQKQYDFVDGNSLYNRCHLLAYKLTAENANERNLIAGTRYFNTIGMTEFEDMVTDYVKDTGNHVMYRVTPIFTGDNLLADGVLMEAESVEDNGEGVLYCVFVYNVQPGVEIDYATGRNRLADDSEEQLAAAQKYMSGINYQTLVLDKIGSGTSSARTAGAAAGTVSAETAAPDIEASEISAEASASASADNTGAAEAEEEQTYILNTNRMKFHYPDCAGVADVKEENKKTFTGTRDQLIDMGYSPCSQCSP